jgi:hypothetical protein
MCRSPPKSSQTSSADRSSRRARRSGSSATGSWGFLSGLGTSSACAVLLRPRSAPATGRFWHRDPHGRWTFYQDQAAELACTRYFGSAVDEVREGPIRIDWTAPHGFHVRAGDGDLEWTVVVGSTPVTRLFNRVGSALPTGAWRSRRVLDVMSRVAGPALRAGRVRLTGRAPNGQRFVANPLIVWVATDSKATVRGIDLGQMGPSPEQAHLRDFTLPQRGMFVVGRAMFTDTAT